VISADLLWHRKGNTARRSGQEPGPLAEHGGASLLVNVAEENLTDQTPSKRRPRPAAAGLQPYDRTRPAAFVQTLAHRSVNRSPESSPVSQAAEISGEFPVQSGTGCIVPSGTAYTCYQGPESLAWPSNSEARSARNLS